MADMYEYTKIGRDRRRSILDVDFSYHLYKVIFPSSINNGMHRP
jgi:hypothetical protein